MCVDKGGEKENVMHVYFSVLSLSRSANVLFGMPRAPYGIVHAALVAGEGGEGVGMVRVPQLRRANIGVW